MRDIKFRMWDTQDERMIPLHTILAPGHYRDSGMRIPSDYNFQISENEILMQYTGRVDCNRTEIYEGDIIAQNGIANSVVAWENERWYLKIENKNQIVRQELGNQNSGWLEIIGNIYEHPNLINQ